MVRNQAVTQKFLLRHTILATALVFLTTLSIPAHAQSDALVLGSNGNVGIGTANPTSKLHVESNQNTRLLVRNTAAMNVEQVMFRLDAQGDDKIRFVLSAAGGESIWTFDNNPVTDQLSISKAGTGINEFLVRSNGDGRFRGRVTASGFNTSSSRTLKTDIEALDERAVLEQVLDLPVAQWRYRDDAEERVHIGPMAEDFQAVFGLGDGRNIPLSDLGGVTLAAVQGLYRELRQRDEEITRLQQDNVALRDELTQALLERDKEIARLQRDNASLREGLAQDNRELRDRLAVLEQLLLGQQDVARR